MTILRVAALASAALLCPAADFEREVFPIFQRACSGCHGPKTQMARLRVDSRATFLAGGQSGPAIKAGDSANSLLTARLTGAAGVPPMPPGGKLGDEEIRRIREWIDAGAIWPDHVGVTNAEIRRHWAYIAPKRPAQSGIDTLIRARLAAEGLSPSPEAAKETLLRRVSLDLTGLPPTLAEIDAFLEARSPDAYEKQVDRLLASPRFGERWAQWWLDLARYADTNGYESDEPRSIWPWRDWVINAFNRNMPFDRFTIEQIAGDLLPGATEDQIIATGFHRNTLINSEAGSKDDEFRDAAVKDRLETTATVWLGTTIGCAQCHNHKYDPFTQKDYYRLYAFFNSTAESSIQIDQELKVFRGDREELDRRRAAYAPLAKLLDTPSPELDSAQQLWEQDMRARLPMMEQSWTKLGSTQEQQVEFAAARPISGLRLSAAAELEIEAWTSADLKQQEELLASQPAWGDWHMAGPFEAANQEEAHRTAYAPERGVTLDASWKKRADLPDGAFYQLDGYNCSVYLYRTVTAKQAQRIRVGLGSAQGVKLFLNGRQIFATGALEELKPEDGLLDLDLSAGVNHLLLKYTNGPGYYRYYFKRFVGLDRKVKPIEVSQDRRILRFEPAIAPGTLRFGFRQKPREAVTVDASSMTAGDIAGYLRMPAGIAAIVRKTERTPEEQRQLAQHYRWNSPLLADVRLRHDRLKKEADEYFDRHAVSTLVMKELEKPRETHVQNRGNFLDLKERVEPGPPAILPQLPGGAPANRLALAQWLVSPQNPLTARVIANHLWRAIFGAGLVKTGEDFGAQGERPSHPELLDLLAVELMEDRWDFKNFVKKIVMSETYRQSSHADSTRLAKDPDNRLLSRGPRFRLAGEAIRDVTLASAGLLSARIGGPSVFPPMPASVFENLFIEGGIQSWKVSEGEDRYRRGMYTFYKRAAVYPTFMTFDAPERNVCTVERPRSNTPLQALTTLNDEAFVEAARALAARLEGAASRDRLTHGFRIVTARRPSEKELAALEALLEKSAAQYRSDPAAAKKMTAGGDPALAPWVVVSNVLLNLDEALTKE
ncbi:MAG: PSD1 and planctomycete cytochrome C domain-containing protein [Bryobacteraceae bacterium]|nr:PSD1 and planctomycete cytochrome C domain-containing protein [Bryobacteraceae bacterium]